MIQNAELGRDDVTLENDHVARRSCEVGPWRDPFQRDLEVAFDVASRGQPSIKTLWLGAQRIQLEFANTTLLGALSPALAALHASSALPSRDAQPPPLRLAVWDTDSTGVSPPHCPWPFDRLGPLGEVCGLGGVGLRVAYNVDSRCLSWFDESTGRGHLWMRSVHALPPYERAAPLRTLLSWAVRLWSSELVHAGCVAAAGRALLLVGKGGSGKSTCALSCLGSHLQYVADDYCLLSMASGRPVAQAVYSTAKLHPAHLSAFLPELAGRAVAHGPTDKVTIYLRGDELAGTARPVPIAALVVPRVSAIDGVAVAACTPAQALAALAPSSIFQTPGLGAPTFRFLADVARSVPCHTLTLGAERDRVREALCQLLS